MTILQSIQSSEFCGNCPDYIIDSDASIDFEVKKDSQSILNERYSPDAVNVIRVRDLGVLCGFLLWGNMQGGWQMNHAGQFQFYVDGQKQSSTTFYYSRHNNRRNVADCSVLSPVDRKVTYDGWTEYTTGFLIEDSGRHCYLLRSFKNGVQTAESRCYVTSMPTSYPIPYTVITTLEDVEREVGTSDFDAYEVVFDGGSMRYELLERIPPFYHRIRFKNDYDMPDMVTAYNRMAFESKTEETSSVIAGREQRIDVKAKDEWKLNSGPFHFRSDFRLWRQLVNSTQVQLMVDGEWTDIYMVKHKFEASADINQFQSVEITFRMADEREAFLIDNP